MSNTEVKAQPVTKNNDLGQTGKFVLDNQKSLIFIGAAIVLLVLGYFSYQKFYLAPREVEATNQMYVAQDAWAKKDWDKAIKGDAGYPGFEKIIKDYSNTKAANLAYFYLGTAYLNKGEYTKAIDALTSFRGDDNVVASEALGETGDAYVELKDYNKAETYFQKAADKAKNNFNSPFYLKKLGLVFEAENDLKSAVETYKKIKTDYPQSAEAQLMDEYIARDEAKL
jgi:tetratricopeptide (TPR) repeat protein